MQGINNIFRLQIVVSLFLLSGCFFDKGDNKSSTSNLFDIIKYDYIFTIRGDTITDSLSLILKQKIKESDSLIIRFRAAFYNDNIRLYQENKLVFAIDSLTTNYSTTIAKIIVLKNKKGPQGLFTLFDVNRNTSYDINYKKGYRFLDVYTNDTESGFVFDFNNNFQIFY